MTNYVNQQEAAAILKLPISNFMEMVRNKFIEGFKMQGNLIMFKEHEVKELRRRIVLNEVVS